MEAMNSLNKQELFGTNVEISLAKPPSDKRNKEYILRKREQRMMQMMAETMIYPAYSSHVCGNQRRYGPSSRNYYGRNSVHVGNPFWGNVSRSHEGWHSQVTPRDYQYNNVNAGSSGGFHNTGGYLGKGNWRGYSGSDNPRSSHGDVGNHFKPRYVKFQ